ncbi:MAG: copper resistance system multicopper oxidase [Gemmatimonadota bacterium]|nr:copper resistance system multicopper oxidase [Gemmatimonadota bacterium]
MTSPVMPESLSRRDFVRVGATLGGLAGLDALVPRYARAGGDLAARAPEVLDGSAAPLDLTIGRVSVPIGDRTGHATTINGSLPGPILRFREGDEAVMRVTNALDEDTSVHWHGILLPNGMDGVPNVNYPGIRPGETFEYRYPIAQYGTYWYHSHSGLQEQLGQYGALIIDPAEPEPFEYDRDYVVVLSDWTFEDPYRIMARLKKVPHYYNRQKRTVFDFIRDAGDQGFGAALSDRLMWGGMRMDPTDIADITGATYTYLMNGLPPDAGWTGLFEPGERVRLRFINASAASFFDVRIPGLPMTVVQSDGQHVKPVETDEFRIGIAETYDVIVEPREDRAYTVFAEAMDRSGYGAGTLAPREGMRAEVPERRARPLLSMADMGMQHDMDDMDGMGDGQDMPGDADPDEAPAMDHGDHGMQHMAGNQDRPPGTVAPMTEHGPDDHGPGSASVPDQVMSRLHEPGNGLGEDGWRVLTYTDLEALEARHHLDPPEREIELHLTGNMERFMWSINGTTFSEAEPIQLRQGERIRLTMVNDTMMNHPMHLHGMWMELENGKGGAIPRQHTVNVKPAEKLSALVTADAPGPWAFHCHVLYHMDAGMFRVVMVGDGEGTYMDRSGTEGDEA